MAEIRIRTKGDWNHTEIVVNGRRLKNLAEFHFSIRGGRKAKMSVKQIDPESHKLIYSSLWGDDFTKMDEEPVEGENKLIRYEEEDHGADRERSSNAKPDSREG